LTYIKISKIFNGNLTILGISSLINEG